MDIILWEEKNSTDLNMNSLPKEKPDSLDITTNTETKSIKKQCNDIGKENNKFYVYALISPIDNNVFYIGKGCGYRHNSHVNNVKKGKLPNNNKYLFRKIKQILDKKLNVEIVFIKKNMNERDAFNLEKDEIKKVKSKNIKICNLTDGGEGASGYVPSDEFRSRLSELFRGQANPFYGKHHSLESRKKIKNNTPKLFGENNPFYGKHHTKKVKKLLSDSQKGLLSKEKHPRWKEVSNQDKRSMVETYKLYGLMYTINKFKPKNYGYDVVKRILMDSNVFDKYKFFGRPKVVIPDEVVTKIVTLRNDGFSIREIVKKLKIENITVSFEKTRKIVKSIKINSSIQK